LSAIRLLIAEPWFASPGHSPQTTVNLARIIGQRADTAYLVTRDAADPVYEHFLQDLRGFGEVITMPAARKMAPSETLRALLRLAALPSRYRRADTVFFLDAHLPTLALAWPWLHRRFPGVRLAVRHLFGPEHVQTHRSRHARWYAVVLNRFLRRDNVELFLRTEELVEAWRAAHPTIPAERFRLLPPTELPDEQIRRDTPQPASRLRVGVIGQLRRGKGIEWLVPMFVANPALGDLCVAGAHADETHHKPVIAPLIRQIDGRVGYMTEAEMNDVAGAQHYLLILYDRWDLRMEASNLYVAARVNRPVVTDASGWCGRMVEAYGCGVVVQPSDRRDPERMERIFATLPLPGSAEYDGFLAGLERFRQEHAGGAVRAQVLSALGLAN
jgi:glycosyltransferase involved in cell wall biosynthesis